MQTVNVQCIWIKSFANKIVLCVVLRTVTVHDWGEKGFYRKFVFNKLITVAVRYPYIYIEILGMGVILAHFSESQINSKSYLLIGQYMYRNCLTYDWTVKYEWKVTLLYVMTTERGPSWSWLSWSFSRSTTTCVINVYHHECLLCVRVSLRWGVLDTTLCDQVCQWLATD